MTQPPPEPKLYHITHLDNLPGILAEGHLLCDRQMKERGGPAASIGMSEIKLRRIEQLAVSCHPETKVGDYVPFFFCPRSVMLFVIARRNHPELAYRGGQDPVLHLEVDLHEVVRWADGKRVRWAFSLSNAGARYAEIRSRVAELDELDWPAIATRDFKPQLVKERKQAEFLVHERFPFELVRRIGVNSAAVRGRVAEALAGSHHIPPVEVRPEWYF